MTQIILISLCFITCFVAFVVTLFDFIHTPEYNMIKGCMFGAVGLTNGLSILFNVFQIAYFPRSHDFPLGYFHLGTVFMGILYLTGLYFYVNKVPEKYCPHTFDIWFNSHTIFHIFVFAAAIEYFFILHYAYNLRKNSLNLWLIKYLWKRFVNGFFFSIFKIY